MLRAFIRWAQILTMVCFLWMPSTRTGLSKRAISAEHHPRHAGRGSQSAHHHGHRHVSPRRTISRYLYFYGSPYGYWPVDRTFGYYVGPLGAWVDEDSPIIYPPVVADAGTWFGPRAIWNQLGISQFPLVVQPKPAGALRPGAGAQPDLVLVRPDEGAVPKPQRDVATLVRARDRARKLMDQGDTQFRSGKYPLAIQRYRNAVAAEPTFADSWFRRGLAELGLARYRDAIASFERGLRFDPNWPASQFRLTDIYPDAEAIAAHREALAAAALADPDESGLLFLLGLHLHFDGQPKRAEPFFQKIITLGEHVEAALAFLPRTESPESLPIPAQQAPRGQEF
ncbi:MAG: tetratricopeptide repeat protein [Pirellulales bacterium]|nr:tetratricopeptide repeat protein [Pirellulales bacterium]